MENCNKYDYDSLQRELKCKCVRDMRNERQREMLRERNKQFQQKLDKMSSFREEQYLKKKNDIDERLIKKENAFLTSLDLVKSTKNQSKKDHIFELTQKEKNAKDKVDYNLKLQEINRIKQAELMQHKSNLFFFFYFLL